MVSFAEGGHDPNEREQLMQRMIELGQGIAPREGYRVELSDIALSDIYPGVDLRRNFKQLLGMDVDNTARFVYGYNGYTETIDLVSMCFAPLERAISEDGSVVADSIYLQRYYAHKDWQPAGFAQTFGRGRETIASPSFPIHDHDEDEIKRLLHPAGLYEIPSDQWRQLDVAAKLTRAQDWNVREEYVTPLPPSDGTTLAQIIVGRKRGAYTSHLTGAAQYRDNYDLTFRKSTPLPHSPTSSSIHEVAIHLLQDATDTKALVMTELAYQRHTSPLSPDVVDLTGHQGNQYQPSRDDITNFLELVNQYLPKE